MLLSDVSEHVVELYITVRFADGRVSCGCADERVCTTLVCWPRALSACVKAWWQHLVRAPPAALRTCCKHKNFAFDPDFELMRNRGSLHVVQHMAACDVILNWGSRYTNTLGIPEASPVMNINYSLVATSNSCTCGLGYTTLQACNHKRAPIPDQWGAEEVPPPATRTRLKRKRTRPCAVRRPHF